MVVSRSFLTLWLTRRPALSTSCITILDTDKLTEGRSRIRFVDQDHLMRLLAVANLTPITWYGDWDRTPITPTSREFIVVTRRAD